MLGTSTTRRLAVTAVTAIALTVASVASAAPALAAEPEVVLHCENHLDNYHCDIEIYGFDDVSNIAWSIDGIFHAAYDDQYGLFRTCRQVGHSELVSVGVLGHKNGVFASDFAGKRIACNCLPAN